MAPDIELNMVTHISQQMLVELAHLLQNVS